MQLRLCRILLPSPAFVMVTPEKRLPRLPVWPATKDLPLIREHAAYQVREYNLLQTTSNAPDAFLGATGTAALAV